MPKEKPIERSINAFYKKRALDLLMYGFADGFKTALPNVSIKQAVCVFLKKYNLSEDDYPYETAVKNYSNINSAFIWKDSK